MILHGAIVLLSGGCEVGDGIGGFGEHGDALGVPGPLGQHEQMVDPGLAQDITRRTLRSLVRILVGGPVNASVRPPTWSTRSPRE